MDMFCAKSDIHRNYNDGIQIYLILDHSIPHTRLYYPSYKFCAFGMTGSKPEYAAASGLEPQKRNVGITKDMDCLPKGLKI